MKVHTSSKHGTTGLCTFVFHQLGRLKIKAKLGELLAAPSPKESGAKGGRGKKGDGQSITLLDRSTISAYRKLAANKGGT